MRPVTSPHLQPETNVSPPRLDLSPRDDWSCWPADRAARAPAPVELDGVRVPLPVEAQRDSRAADNSHSLVHRALELLGPILHRAWPLESARHFAWLLRAIDEAVRRSARSGDRWREPEP